MKKETPKQTDSAKKQTYADSPPTARGFTQPPNPTDHTRVASKRDVSGNNGLANTGPVTDYEERKP